MAKVLGVDGALAQASEGGASVVDEPQVDELGRLGWFMDPEDNEVELWQPPPAPEEAS